MHKRGYIVEKALIVNKHLSDSKSWGLFRALYESPIREIACLMSRVQSEEKWLGFRALT